MAKQYWVRHQSETTGPFSGQQLKQMAAAGMILTADMISADQINWQDAGLIKGLFQAEQLSVKGDTSFDGSPSVEDSPVFSESNWIEQADLATVHEPQASASLTGQAQNVVEAPLSNPAKSNAQARVVFDEAPTTPLPGKRPLRILILVILPIAMVCMGMLLYTSWKDKPTVETGTPGPKLGSVFTSDPDEVGGEHAAGINAFFDELRHAVAEGDKDKVAELFDCRMTFRLVKQQKILPTSVIADEDKIAEYLSREIANQMVNPSVVSGWDRHEIRHVRFIRPGIEAVVYVRMRGDGVSAKMRWWLFRKGGKWSAYDFEDCTLPFRMSFMMMYGLEKAARNDLSPMFVLDLTQAIQEVLSGDTRAGLAKLRGLEKAEFAPVVEAMRLLFISASLFILLEYEGALTAADQAEVLNNDMPLVHKIRGDCHNALEQYAKALNDAERYAKCLGKDAIYFLIVGNARRGMGQTAEAIRAYENALADNPSDIEPFLMLVKTLPAEQSQNLAKHYKGLGKVDDKFTVMADQLFAERDAASLRTLIDLHRGIRPGDRNIAVFERKLSELKNLK